MLLALALARAAVVPAPRRLAAGAQRYLARPELACAGPDGRAPCPAHVHQNFAFYARLMFQRGAPYTAAEYAARVGADPADVVAAVRLRIADTADRVDLLAVDESYSIVAERGAVAVDAATPFAAARAFQTLMQLARPATDDERVYVLGGERVEDAPALRWRHLGVDACSHYMTKEDLRRQVDAASLLKLNVILLSVVCAHSFPLHFPGTPLERLADGAFSPYHFYDAADAAELQAYAKMRGVVVVPEVQLVGAAAPYRHRGPGTLADCPELVARNPANAVLDVLDPAVLAMAGEVARLTVAAFFPPGCGVRPVLHLGGEQISLDCLARDQGLARRLAERRLDAGQAVGAFVRGLGELVPRDAVQVYAANVLQYCRELPPGRAVVHYTAANDRAAANQLGLPQISSVNLFTHLMHPGGGHHYFWQDTWRDLHRQDVAAGAAAGLALGGGVIQTGAHCYGRACEQHAFQRAFGACENLWKGAAGGWGAPAAYQELGCRFEAAGLGNGPLDIGAPCPGHSGRRL